MKTQLIDAHLHWWDLETNYYPWLCDDVGDKDGVYEPGALTKNYLPENYLADANAYDILGAVHIQAEWDHNDDLGETKWLDTLSKKAEMANFPFAIVAFANLADSNVETLLAAHCQYQHVRGIRQMLNFMPDNPDYCWAPEEYLKNTTWQNNFKLLEKYKLSFDLMCFSHQMLEMEIVVKTHPNVQIILEHAGMPVDEPVAFEQWKTGIYALAKHDNVACKLGGLGTMIPNWTAQHVDKIFAVLHDAFGSHRLLFATNFPTDSVFCDYDTAVSLWLQAIATLPTDEQTDILVNNCRRIYRF